VIAIVVAHGSNRVIGRAGRMPWHLPSDLRRFRRLTLGGTVVMGRRTFEALPAAVRPLPGRRNLVLSSDGAYEASGSEVWTDLEAALAACGRSCFVIGGGVVYEQTLPLAGRVYATQVDGQVAGDVFFPSLDEREWRCVERSAPLFENGYFFTFCTYARLVSGD
jgi:dihydrofolate reductase